MAKVEIVKHTFLSANYSSWVWCVGVKNNTMELKKICVFM